MLKTFDPKTESLGAYLLRVCPLCDSDERPEGIDAEDVSFSDFDYEDSGCRWYVACDYCGCRSDVRLYSDRRAAKALHISVDGALIAESLVHRLDSLGIAAGVRSTKWAVTYVEPK